MPKMLCFFGSCNSLAKTCNFSSCKKQFFLSLSLRSKQINAQKSSFRKPRKKEDNKCMTVHPYQIGAEYRQNILKRRVVCRCGE